MPAGRCLVGMSDEFQPRRRFNSTGFAAGAGAGGFLFLILSLATGSAVLGLVFGLLPGAAIGLWLALTTRE